MQVTTARIRVFVDRPSSCVVLATCDAASCANLCCACCNGVALWIRQTNLFMVRSPENSHCIQLPLMLQRRAAAFCKVVCGLQAGIIDLASLLAEVQAEILPGQETFRPTARQYTALNYKGVCCSIIISASSRSMMDSIFDMATAAKVAFQAAHQGDQKATGDLSHALCL